MKKSLKRQLAVMLGLAVVASLSIATAAPAGANAAGCTTVLNTTPGIEADLDGDGYPDVRAPRIYDVTLCSEHGAGYVVYPPELDNCSDVPKSVRCMAVYITVLPAYAGAYAEGEICFSIEGSGQTCEPFDTGTINHVAPVRMCVGYDLDGGHPCSGNIFAVE